MLIGIDYDETFTEDPAFWGLVFNLGHKCGHRFVCVTGRASPPDFTREPYIPIPVVCADAQLKDIAARAAGYMVDVWIDDMPGTIKGAQKLTWDEPSDGEIREAVNELRDIAREFHATEQLRERISRVVVDLVKGKS